MTKKISSIFKYNVCYKSNITGRKICMPERNKKDAMSNVRRLKADNRAHKQAEDFVLWKNIRILKK